MYLVFVIFCAVPSTMLPFQTIYILRANIASEHVTSTLVTGTTAATFSSFEKVSQLTVKECILNSAPKSCELDPSLPSC